LQRILRVAIEQTPLGRQRSEFRNGSSSSSTSKWSFSFTGAQRTSRYDAHNIVVVGVDDGDMARAVQRLAEMGGGLWVIADRGVQAELPLPVAGLLSDAPLAEVVAASRQCVEATERLGCTFEAPFQTMSFLALSVIPRLKITDRGLVDVDRFELVPLGAE
jgi:adenine deaminase